MTDDTHTIRSGGLTATVKAQGAELCSLKNAGVEFLWQAGPAWTRHAPLLFPIVGRLVNDEMRHRGKTYPAARWCLRTAKRRARSIRSRSGWL